MGEHGSIMEKVVQESKLLQQQAEENSKVATYTYMFIHLLEDKLFVTLSFYFVAVTGVSHGPWSCGWFIAVSLSSLYLLKKMKFDLHLSRGMMVFHPYGKKILEPITLYASRQLCEIFWNFLVVWRVSMIYFNGKSCLHKNLYFAIHRVLHILFLVVVIICCWSGICEYNEYLGSV